jgi:hypothetical protein
LRRMMNDRNLTVPPIRWQKFPAGFGAADLQNLNKLTSAFLRMDDNTVAPAESSREAIFMRSYLHQKLLEYHIKQRWKAIGAEYMTRSLADAQTEDGFVPKVSEWTGLDLDVDFEVQVARPAGRVGPDGQLLQQLLVIITQQKTLSVPRQNELTFQFQGGCTLLIDADDASVRYSIVKNITSKGRQQREQVFLDTQRQHAAIDVTRQLALRGDRAMREPLAMLHRSHLEDQQW